MATSSQGGYIQISAFFRVHDENSYKSFMGQKTRSKILYYSESIEKLQSEEVTCDRMAELSCQLVQPREKRESRRHLQISRSAICVHTIARKEAVCAVCSSTRRSCSAHSCANTLQWVSRDLNL